MDTKTPIQNNATELAKTYTDFSGFNELRAKVRDNDPQAIQAVAKQFESIFVSMMLKNMRQANAVFSEDNELNSNMFQMYQEMFDNQIALDISRNKGIGLADVIIRQLTPKSANNANSLDENLNTIESISNAIPTPILTSDKQSAWQHDGKSLPPLFDTPISFVKAVWPHAVEVAKELGTDPRILVAQAALETRWGKSIMRNPDGSSSHNLFGIKADKSWESDRVLKTTLEHQQGVAQKVVAPFRSYNSYAESFRDYANFLRANPRYSQLLNGAKDPDSYAEGLQAAGYATDPHYANKIKSLFYSDTLAQALVTGN